MFEEIKQSVITGDEAQAAKLTQQLLDKGTDPQKVLKEGLVPGMDVVGARFKAYDMWLPEVIMSAKAMKAATALLKPYLEKSGGAMKLGKIVIATVEGDVHDIGKNLVSMMLEGAGFKTIDLGVDLSVEKLLDKVKEIKPQVLGLSALLTTSMPEMKRVIEELEVQGIRRSLKVMVGGAPVDRTFAEKIGADGYGANAAEAVELARRFASQ
jgi:5-methyltetrahydrofolate--homocysteine methyltransferase